MIENKKLFLTIILLYVIYAFYKTIVGFSKGRVEPVLLYSHRPIYFKKKPVVAIASAIGQVLILLGFIIGYIILIFLAN